jgi:hypothetical protein
MANEIENYEPPNRGGRGCLIGTVIGLVIIILALCTIGFIGTDKITSYFTEKEAVETTVPESDNIDNVVEPEITITDILEARAALREERRIDSVFMAIPDFELAAILMNIGVGSTKADIVYEYELHRKSYEDVKLGREIQTKIIQRNDTLIPKDSI